ncbi:MAG: phosphatidate cytidylyltransferase, partial [Gammaproteobacteria bacterium]|nr:phosphatidate cytidylyltransferase [Gammaproteobacteria bacterium]
MSNLTKRLITAGVGIPLLFLSLFAYDGEAVPAVLLVLVVLLLWECSALLQIKGLAPRAVYSGIGGLAFLFIVTMSQDARVLTLDQVSVLLIHLISVLLAWFIFWVVVSDETRRFWVARSENETPQAHPLITVRISEATLTAKVHLSIGCLLVLVGLGIALYGLQIYCGSGVLVCVLAIAWATDTGAYFAGRLFGKRPLAKHISPNKTIEGTIGGCFLGSLLALILGFFWMQPMVGWSSIAVVSMAIAIPLAAIGGDLFESVLKRIS